LVPQSISILANTFTSGGDYLQKLEELCHSVGTLSDDGDAWVDKYCGCVLKKIDSVNEDGYDESGFKVTTHGIIEKDLGTVAGEILSKKEIKFGTSSTSIKSEPLLQPILHPPNDIKTKPHCL
jgi:hypothetical protein